MKLAEQDPSDCDNIRSQDPTKGRTAFERCEYLLYVLCTVQIDLGTAQQAYLDVTDRMIKLSRNRATHLMG